MKRKYSLSVIIITKNEEVRIETCLRSIVNISDEIIVVDSGSTDGTLDICRRYTNKITITDWPGYGKQKQRALNQASCDWVLSIDSDEALDAEMQSFIDRFLSNDRQNISGVQMSLAATLYGKCLSYGRASRAPIRLVWNEGASFNEQIVHESLLPPSGKIIRGSGFLLHNSHKDYGHGIMKNVNYAWLGAQKYFSQGRRCKYVFVPILKAMWTFFQIYFVKFGFLDGAVGLLSAMNYSCNTLNKYMGLWTLTRAEKENMRQ